MVCMPVAPSATAGEGVELEEVPGGSMATTVHKGPYAAMEETYRAMEGRSRLRSLSFMQRLPTISIRVPFRRT